MRNRRRMQDDEIPKSVLKMRQEKERREETERNRRAKGKREEENKKGQVKRSKSKSKQDKQYNPRKKTIKKVILFIIVAALITFGILMAISAFTWKEIAEDMFNNENSVVVDTTGETIAKLGVEQKKMTVDFEDIPDNLVNAYVAIEDERFYSHHGVDIKRTGAAILNYITHFGNSSFGGSTITQQLVKNMTGDTTDSITRKVNEWWKAFLLESYFDKEEILEMYLNIIYVGPNIYGVQTGAKYYFDKDVEDLSLAECAYLAGINNAPNAYNPFGDDDNTELITNRTSTVLQQMLDLGYIEEDEYNDAISEVNSGLDFDRGEIETENPIYSYHTDALITQLVSDLAEDKNISETFATNYLNMAGLTIHSTQVSDIQSDTEREFKKSQYILNSKDGESTSQAAMVIMDHESGKVIACVGGLGEKETFRGLNRATQSQRQTGSSIKPLAVLVPGIDKKIFTAATIYDDDEKTFAGNYSPGNSDGGYLGEITVRRALESSQNIPFVEMMEEVTPKRAISYLEDMGITSLTQGDESLALALGGLENGVTPLEMAAAYATIAKDGIYIEPTFYTNVINKKGDEVLKVKQKSKRVFSSQVAYVMKELLKQPVEGEYGTATYCSISGIDVAAKTGTTDDNYDKWLCGFTPYYTAVTWFGFDQNETIKYNNQNPAGIIWANVMRNVHSGFSRATFREPSWITTETICADTGMLAKTGCKDTYTEYFLWGTEPDECDKHSGSRVTNTHSSQDDNTSSGVYVDDDEDLKLNPNDDEEKPKVENRVQEETINEVVDEPENTVDEPENVVVEEPVVENEVDEPVVEEPTTPPSSTTDQNEVGEQEPSTGGATTEEPTTGQGGTTSDSETNQGENSGGSTGTSSGASSGTTGGSTSGGNSSSNNTVR